MKKTGLILLILVLIAGVSLALVFTLGGGKFSGATGPKPFPSGAFLAGEDIGPVIIKGRVVSRLGASESYQNILFDLVDTTSGESLEAPILLSTELLAETVIPGQVYTLTVKSSRGALISSSLEKY